MGPGSAAAGALSGELATTLLPGQAGTVQEIFQAVTENFYAADRSQVAPLVLGGAAVPARPAPA